MSRQKQWDGTGDLRHKKKKKRTKKRGHKKEDIKKSGFLLYQIQWKSANLLMKNIIFSRQSGQTL